jgi:hypothetical protein
MSSKNQEGVQEEGPLVKMLERQRVQQAAADAAKKLADAAGRCNKGSGGDSDALEERVSLFARFCSNRIGGRA